MNKKQPAASLKKHPTIEYGRKSIDIKTLVAVHPEKSKLGRLAIGKLASPVLGFALELNVFEKLKNKPLKMEELAKLIETSQPSTRVFVQWLCILELAKYDKGNISNSTLGETCLNLSKDDYEKLMKQSLLGENTEFIRDKLFHPSGQPWYNMRDGSGNPIHDQFYASDKLQKRRIQWGEELAETYDFSDNHVMMDVGGASTGWCIGIRKHFPHIKCIVFDLPQVRGLALSRIAEANQQEYITFSEGSFFKNDLPAGTDVVLLANVLHDWSYEDNKTILKKVHDCLPKNGVVLVKEFYFEEDMRGPVSAGMQALSVLGKTQKSGWQPTYEEMTSLLKDMNFPMIEKKEGLLIARKSNFPPSPRL